MLSRLLKYSVIYIRLQSYWQVEIAFNLHGNQTSGSALSLNVDINSWCNNDIWRILVMVRRTYSLRWDHLQTQRS